MQAVRPGTSLTLSRRAGLEGIQGPSASELHRFPGLPLWSGASGRMRILHSRGGQRRSGLECTRSGGRR